MQDNNSIGSAAGSITTVEYQTIQDESLTTLASEIQYIERQTARIVLEGAIEIGHRLLAAKQKIGHGNFEDWCSENLNYSLRKAENFMRLSTAYGDENSVFAKTQTSADLSISKALSLLALPDEEVESFAETHEISDMSVRELDDEIRKLKEEKAQADKSIETQEAVIQGLNQELEESKIDLLAKEKEIAELTNTIANAEAPDVEEYKQSIDALKAEAEKSKEKEKDLKKKIAELKKDNQEEIEKALSDEREKLYEQCKTELKSELARAGEINCELQTEIDNLQKKLKNTSDIDKIRFKVLTDQLQDTFQNCCSLIEDQEKDVGEHWKNILKKVVESLQDTLSL